MKHFEKHFLASCPSAQENLHFYSISACQHYKILMGFAAVGRIESWSADSYGRLLRDKCLRVLRLEKPADLTSLHTPEKIQAAPFTSNECTKTKALPDPWLCVARNIKILTFFSLHLTKEAAFCRNISKNKNIANCNFNSHKLHLVYRV